MGCLKKNVFEQCMQKYQMYTIGVASLSHCYTVHIETVLCEHSVWVEGVKLVKVGVKQYRYSLRNYPCHWFDIHPLEYLNFWIDINIYVAKHVQLQGWSYNSTDCLLYFFFQLQSKSCIYFEAESDVEEDEDMQKWIMIIIENSF